MTDVSVVICTYNRPNLVLKTIQSCLAQDVDPDLVYEIVVVDNSSDGNARQSIESVAATSAVPVHYFNERRTNISHARNCGIVNAKGRYVAFIDDDEQASPGWLQALLNVCHAHDADMVLGPVEPVFASGHAPTWDPQETFYGRKRNIGTGDLVTFYANTGNILIDAATCLQDDEPFNPVFGRTGGEDTDYSMRMQSLGRKVVWCAEARVTEFLPQDRESPDYVVKRAFRTAKAYYRCRIANSRNPNAVKIHALGTGLVQLAGWVLPWLFTYPFETPYSVKCRVRVFRALGRLTWWRTSVYP